MCHSGEDHVGLKAADEAQKGEDCVAYTTDPQSMHNDRERQGGGRMSRPGNEAKVDFVFPGRQASGQEGSYALRAASTQVWNQQKDPRPLNHGRNMSVQDALPVKA